MSDVVIIAGMIVGAVLVIFVLAMVFDHIRKLKEARASRLQEMGYIEAEELYGKMHKNNALR